jgi:hypothetical protein
MIGESAFLTEARKSYHAALLGDVLRLDRKKIKSGEVDTWTNADGNNTASRQIAAGIASRIGDEVRGATLAGQMSGRHFEEVCRRYLEEVWERLDFIRPGSWRIENTGSLTIAAYDQYAHLEYLDELSRKDSKIAAALGSGYLIKPDVVIIRDPEEEEFLNREGRLVDDSTAKLSSLRKVNGGMPLLHASVSCKWTIRSDRAQNARSEALNFVRNRKGHLPHIVVVTAEPTPSRISSLALGTGDIDCVYHFALPELEETVEELAAGNPGYEDTANLLRIMVAGRRLKDISDLPLDLAV